MVDLRTFACLSAALLLGCATASRSTTPPLERVSRDYAPVPLGATWTYAVSYPGQQGSMTVSIVGEKDGYAIDNRDEGWRHTPEGLRDRQRYLIRHPLETGTEWKVILSASAVEHYRITEVGGECAAQAGSFSDCLVVESWIRKDAQMTLRARFTWAKGVGLVKLETEADITGKGRIPQVKQTLVHYSLSGGRPKTEPPAGEDAPPAWTR